MSFLANKKKDTINKTNKQYERLLAFNILQDMQATLCCWLKMETWMMLDFLFCIIILIKDWETFFMEYEVYYSNTKLAVVLKEKTTRLNIVTIQKRHMCCPSKHTRSTHWNVKSDCPTLTSTGPSQQIPDTFIHIKSSYDTF